MPFMPNVHLKCLLLLHSKHKSKLDEIYQSNAIYIV
jgi:hypothetical protein